MAPSLWLRASETRDCDRYGRLSASAGVGGSPGWQNPNPKVTACLGAPCWVLLGWLPLAAWALRSRMVPKNRVEQSPAGMRKFTTIHSQLLPHRVTSSQKFLKPFELVLKRPLRHAGRRAPATLSGSAVCPAASAVPPSSAVRLPRARALRRTYCARRDLVTVFRSSSSCPASVPVKVLWSLRLWLASGWCLAGGRDDGSWTPGLVRPDQAGLAGALLHSHDVMPLEFFYECPSRMLPRYARARPHSHSLAWRTGVSLRRFPLSAAPYGAKTCCGRTAHFIHAHMSCTVASTACSQ